MLDNTSLLYISSPGISEVDSLDKLQSIIRSMKIRVLFLLLKF